MLLHAARRNRPRWNRPTDQCKYTPPRRHGERSLNFILPLLFGVIGAIGYVVRSISDEITATTFSPTAPTRYLMRVTLGALAGVVVGFFTNISAGISLSPLALAFLAGYGVEALFAMFDNLIAKFKN
jgi:hypothetical protein